MGEFTVPDNELLALWTVADQFEVSSAMHAILALLATIDLDEGISFPLNWNE